MTVQLLPRLTKLGTSLVFESTTAEDLTPEMAKAVINERAGIVSYAASGGQRSDALSSRLTSELRTIAVACGFPDNHSQVAKTKFDRDAAVLLGGAVELRTGEALRDDVWAYLTTVLLPDVVAWRFPDKGLHRFEGGVRNALQRLWIRGAALDREDAHDDRWGLVRTISEDAAVQIFERPSMGGSPRLARSIAEVWAHFSSLLGRGAMEPIMRRAMKLIRLRNEIVDLAGLGDNERQVAVAACFELVIESPKAD
jgi:hypothetical protein